MLFISVLAQIAHPFYVLFAWILTGAYALVPNFAIAIAILTLVVMIAISPLTLRGTRGMMRVQVLAPEIQELKARYKVRSDMTAAERQERRQREQEELLALYRKHGVSLTGGLLPFLLQLPVFLVLYGTIRGLVHTTGAGKVAPLYVSASTRLFHNIASTGGQLKAFGINLADAVWSPHLLWAARLVSIALVLVAIALQYVQMKQSARRNPAVASGNRHLRRVQKAFPLVFAPIYLSIPAGVNIYFIVSSIFRIAQQELMYRHDPYLRDAVAKLRADDTGLAGAGDRDSVAAGGRR